MVFSGVCGTGSLQKQASVQQLCDLGQVIQPPPYLGYVNNHQLCFILIVRLTARPSLV